MHMGLHHGEYIVLFALLWPQKKLSKTVDLIKIGSLWPWKNLWGYGRKVHAEFWPLGTPWDPSYDDFCFLCQRTNSWYWIIWSIWRSTGPGRYLIFFLVKLHVEWRQNHVWGCIFDPSYGNVYENMYFCKGWIGWYPWLKRALTTMSNGLLKVQKALVLGDFMRVSW